MQNHLPAILCDASNLNKLSIAKLINSCKAFAAGYDPHTQSQLNDLQNVFADHFGDTRFGINASD